jgi:hypothetical protein
MASLMLLVRCPSCGYAANVERAETRRGDEGGATFAQQEMQEVATPGKHAVEGVARFLKVAPKRLVKTLHLDVGGIGAWRRGPSSSLAKQGREGSKQGYPPVSNLRFPIRCTSLFFLMGAPPWNWQALPACNKMHCRAPTFPLSKLA